MSKEVMVVAWCDGTIHEVQERAEVERTVQVDGGVPVTLDLCLVCNKVFDDLASLMQRGAPVNDVPKRSPKAQNPPPEEGVSGSKRTSKRLTEENLPKACPEENCIDPRTNEQYVAPSRAALGQHLKIKHDKRLGDYTWEVSA